MSNRDLEDFVDGAVAVFERLPDADDYDDAAEESEPAQADADEEALPDGWNEWVDSLTPAEIELAKGSAQWAEYQFGVWLTKQDAAAAFERAHHPDGSDPEGEEEPAPQTGAEVVDWVYAHAAVIRRDHGMGPAEYLAALAGSSRAEWRRFATEAGIPPDAKPSYGQLPRASQAAVVRADVANWTPEDFRRG